MRVEKTFSCSNTSKNAVRLYCYKEQFLSFCRIPPFGFPHCPDRDFSAESGAKISHIFWTTKSFWKIFFQKFSEPFLLSFRTVFLIRSGCKGKSFFRISKRFWNFFQNFSEPVFSAPEQYFSLEADAKIRAFRSYFQIIPGLFFDNFTTFFTHGYRSAS